MVNKLTNFIKSLSEKTILVIITVCVLTALVSCTMFFIKTIEDMGGPRQIIVNTGKGIKSIVQDINEE